ncbi:hypothetical protein [Geoglobus ahangari]
MPVVIMRWGLILALVLAILVLGCSQEEAEKAPTPTPTPEKTATPTPTMVETPSKEQVIAEKFQTSLHYTRNGKAYFYSKDNGGFEALTGVPIEKIGCMKCHAKTKADGSPIEAEEYTPDCNDCHVEIGDKPSSKVCLGCHSRQGVEIKLESAKPELFSDVHRSKGMECIDCHTEEEMHGDGNKYNSMLEGAIKVDCENCHTSVPENTAHSIHMSKVDCSACHVKTVISCYNCHLESAIKSHVKRPYGPISGFKFLINFNGKVTTATLMAVQYENSTFYVIAPFYSHTVTKDIECSDCHGNEALKEYDENGKIVITAWNSTAGKLEWRKGVIPVVPDWSTAFQFDFLTYTGNTSDPFKPFDTGNWTFLKHGADKTQMLFGEPLTEEQLDKLRMNIG